MKPVFIIAEAGVNHNGSLERARELVDVAAEAGADAVKFQTFTAEKVVSRKAPKAGYQIEQTGSDTSQWEMLKALELAPASHHALKARCLERGIEFLSTPFDLESANFLLNEVGVSRVKIPSGEITCAPLLLRIASSGKPVILSTGASSLGDVEAALGVLAFGYTRLSEHPGPDAFRRAFASPEGQHKLQANVTLLHCTTEYPAPVSDANLSAMDTLRAAFHLEVGLSDHTQGITIPIAAVARGATVIEKHFTLSHDLEGPDHRASLEPGELKAMVRAIRDVELAIGDGSKRPAPSELENQTVIRKSLMATRKVKKGEIWDESNLIAKRPGTDLSPFLYWDYLGRPAERDYDPDEMLP